MQCAADGIKTYVEASTAKALEAAKQAKEDMARYASCGRLRGLPCRVDTDIRLWSCYGTLHESICTISLLPVFAVSTSKMAA